MPLVFVHGVSNRDSPEYRENRLSRDAFFRALGVPKLGLDGESVKIFSPSWSPPDRLIRGNGIGRAASGAKTSAAILGATT
jgi:hypothetical protein